MQLHPLKNNIMFRFLDDTGGAKGKFTDRKTPSGIIIPQHDNQQKQPRWGEVLAVGPEVDGINIGDFIYIETLMWSYGTEVDGVKMWKTDDTKVIFVTNDELETTKTHV
jgi:co-chaperonin GroES (HSP10)